MTWNELCHREDCRGRWVALAVARYEEATGRAAESEVVDMDDQLDELCSRVRDSFRKNCAIVFVSP